MSASTIGLENLLYSIGSRNLILFLIGKLTASVGSSMYSFAVGLYVLSVTGSSVSFAITLLSSSLPRVILGPIAGVICDRVDRKKIIILSDWLCVILLTGLWLVFMFYSQSIWILYVSATLLSIINTFYSTAINAAIPNMIENERLQKAMSLNQIVLSSSMIAGPILAGILYGIYSFSFFIGISIFTFAVSAIVSIFIHYHLHRKDQAANNKEPFFSSLKSGIVYSKSNPFLKNLMGIAFVINFLMSAYPVCVPFLVITILQKSSFQLGIVESGFAIGMLLLSLVLSIVKKQIQSHHYILGGLIGIGIIISLISLPSVFGEHSIWSIVYMTLLSFLLGITCTIINIPIFVKLQSEIDDNYRGRVMSLLETVAIGTTPIGYILFGFLLDVLPITVVMCTLGILLICFALFHYSKRTMKSIIHQNITELNG